MTESSVRRVESIIVPEPVVEGAGVHLRRSIATPRVDHVDPFLLFDHFRAVDPADYEPGFPFHPHRGIETVTYMLAGEVRHGDSLGNRGSIGAGDLQWMTAGSGILHEEMPQVRPEGVDGFQLWVNLPARDKMTRPRYQDIRSASIPEVETGEGADVRVVAGRLGETAGPVTGIAADPTYLDVRVPAGRSFRYGVARGHSAIAYVFEGEGFFGEGPGAQAVGSPRMAVFSDGEVVVASAGEKPFRFLLISAPPLNEPIARYGPFVMNTRQEIEETLRELRSGRFIKTEPAD
jgi:redox-sensitive bicupin YhaK (pirin superfamily)